MNPSINSRRKSSQRKKRSRPFGKLTIDTKFASQGNPYESRVQGLSFVSFEESKARKNAHARKAGSPDEAPGPSLEQPERKRSLPQPISPAQLDLGRAAALKDGPSRRGIAIASGTDQQSRQDSLALPALHTRIKGLRPSPLKLNKDISPSDRAITIGISPSVSNFTNSPSPILPRSPASRNIVDPRTGQEISTPKIVITPAKDRFSPSDLPHNSGYRPASSIYSRYTTCAPRSGQGNSTPPVPPLPQFLNAKAQLPAKADNPRESTTTTFEEDLPVRSVWSVSTTWTRPESNEESTSQLRQSKRSTSGLPTPRRSKGWWNIITSPFSAKTPTFWRSPPLPEESSDHMPILGDAASMGSSDPHAGVIFTNRAPGDTDLRSAPASGVDFGAKDDLTRRGPKRSDTAPGALDANDSSINIYRIPSTGEAAAYYNLNKHSPSLCAQSRSLDDNNNLDGWSPSQSVFIPEHDSRPSPATAPGMVAFDPAISSGGDYDELKETGMSDPANEPTIKSPEADRGMAVGNSLFSTPSEDELKSAGLSKAPPQRGFTQATMDSMMSPMSATPVVEDAHIARMMGPQSARGEQRQVEVEPAPTPSHYGLGFATLGAATISHSEERRPPPAEPPLSEKPFERPPHIRQDSHGLGISDGERELFPPPQMLSEKPRLGTDRFGQLTVRTVEDQRPSGPWYRRFFWFIAAAGAALLALLIVLMVVLIPQSHNDMAVQATWVNLTGFPALVTGVSTIIQPNKTGSRDTCVAPSGMWSCAAPTADETSLPNFRFEIRFRNGTMPRNETAPASHDSGQTTKRWQEKSALHKFIRRSTWSDYLFTPSPSPPGQSDQEFMGRTTDNVSAPYYGEETPFYISLVDTIALPSSTLHKRDSASSNFSYPYPDTSGSEDEAPSKNASTDATKDFPSAALQSNGQPVTQQLYPFASAQPLRLFDRGLDSEHYGFYTYFDRTIYVSGLTVPPTANSNFSANVALANASAVCTFSQTRFLVQIWTKKNTVGAVDGSGLYVPAGNSTANDMQAPGSFPYSVTVTIDRHGGEAKKKGVFCYGLDADHHVMDDNKIWIEENRAVGGSLINPADIPSGNSTSADKRDAGEGSGIDGGSGGCDCQWQNGN